MGRLIVRPSSVLFALTIHTIFACYQFALLSFTDWFFKDRAMWLLCLCDNACKRCHLFVVRICHLVPVAGFSLSLCSMHVVNSDVNMVKLKIGQLTTKVISNE